MDCDLILFSFFFFFRESIKSDKIRVSSSAELQHLLRLYYFIYLAKVIAPLRVLKPRHFSNITEMDVKPTGINLRQQLCCKG